jgi:predicted RNA-binding Zn-ribbon protein involved in translation (DUF1610 family)/uncharacterized small protein (DUF1192 family)
MAEEMNPSSGAPRDNEGSERVSRDERKKQFPCGFCGAVLVGNGDVIRMSDEAKAFRDAAEKRDEYKNKCTSLETKIGELETEIARLKAAPVAETSVESGPRIHVRV